MTVEYDGTCYKGFQYQRNARTIQEELERAIACLTGENVRVRAAGRTDAGVHALGQVVAFDTVSGHNPDTVTRALNHYLPSDIAVRYAVPAGDDFDPRRCAVARRYRYTILNSLVRSPLTRWYCHLEPSHLDSVAMKEASELFIGVHDFKRFAGRPESPDASTVRMITDVSVEKTGDTLEFKVEGNAFLPHQVRRMAGALVDVGRGALTSQSVSDMLVGESACTTARSLPAHGLCLLRVEYPHSVFGVCEQNDRSI